MKSFCQKIAASFSPGDVILIGGLSRSGKTTFSAALSESLGYLGKSNHIISLDCWLLDKGERGNGVIGRYDLIPITTAIQELMRTKNNLILEIAQYDKLLQQKIYRGHQISISPNDILIIEGVLALMLSSVVPNAKKYYLHIDERLRKIRVIKEYLSRGKDKEDAEEIYISRQLDEVPVIQATSKDAIHINIQKLIL